MTRDRAVYLLRRYRRKEPSQPLHYSVEAWDMYEYGEKAYTEYTVKELIGRIRNSPDTQDPLVTVHEFLCWIDGEESRRNNPIIAKFIFNMIMILDDLEQYLGENNETKEDNDAQH